MLYQQAKFKFVSDQKIKAIYFVEISIIKNNKIIIVAVDQSAKSRNRTLTYILWKKQVLNMVMHFYDEVKNRIALKMAKKKQQSH